MTISHTGMVFRQLTDGLLRDQSRKTDGTQLTDFLEFRDASSFSALVKRHSSLVWGVCRRLLSHHDAEDAFQAVFLVLFKKANHVLPREQIANWLYGVAYHSALQARRADSSGTTRERQVAEMPKAEVIHQPLWDDLKAILDQELSSLPDKYRSVIVLSDLEGRTRKDVARQLKCPEGTVAGRLARARLMLAKRLTQRGVTVSAAGLTAMLAQGLASAHTPLSLMTSVLETSATVATQGAINVLVSIRSAALADGTLKVMLLGKLKVALLLGIILTTFVSSAFLAIYRVMAAEESSITQQEKRTTELLDAKAIIQKAVEACQKVNVIEYTQEQSRGDQAPTVIAKIRHARATEPSAGMSPGKYHIEIEEKSSNDGTRKFAFSYDGLTLRGIDHQAKVVKVIKAPDERTAASMSFSLGAPLAGCGHFLSEKPFDRQLSDLVSIEQQGTREIMGTECYVLQMVWKLNDPGAGSNEQTTTYFIGKKDFLPRGHESRGYCDYLRIQRFNDPQISLDFAVAAPDGYADQLITGQEAQAKNLLTVGTLAPDWTLADSNGKKYSLKDLRGQLVVLDFWGTWCLPCRKGMPAIQAIHERFKTRGVAVFGIAVADHEGDPVGYMKRMNFTYGLLLKGDSVAADYKASMMPTVYVIGVDGKIMHAESGYREKANEDLVKLIERSLTANKK
ncbi:MAG: sigma-70 family RNA polymerase sigma factor [Gemmatales bacterium]